MVASDHSPAPPAMKECADFFRVWGGISGVQSTLPALLEEGYHRRQLTLPRIARLTATAPAQRFQLANKGSIEIGMDADLTLVDLTAGFTLNAEDLYQKHRISPYIGRSFRGVVRRTLLRGQTIFDGTPTVLARGRLVRPRPSTEAIHAPAGTHA